MDRPASMIDLAFAIDADRLPHDHRFELAQALQDALPWLAQEPEAGVHRLNVVRGGAGEDLLSRRTRLILRVPRERADQVRALTGSSLQVGGCELRVGSARTRELLPHGTLYAWLVAAAASDEAEFIRRAQEELDRLGVHAQLVCGRWQQLEGGRLLGCSLMLSGLAPTQSLALLQQGLGPHRQLGCGLFVAHRSAAAVGSPP